MVLLTDLISINFPHWLDDKTDMLIQTGCARRWRRLPERVPGHFRRRPASCWNCRFTSRSQVCLFPFKNSSYRIIFSPSFEDLRVYIIRLSLFIYLYSPRLSWRDVQHLVVLNSFPPSNSPSWSLNGAGLRSNVLYGFGALDAGRLVAMGRTWKSVPSQIRHTVPCPAGSMSVLIAFPLFIIKFNPFFFFIEN